jgi:Zn-dependent M28 family amino/carboxypeptidase
MRRRRITRLAVWLAHTLVLGCAAFTRAGAESPTLADQYRDVAERIVKQTLAGNDAYAKLEHLCLEIGHRLSGSPQLEKAIDWAVETMKKDGQQNCRREKVMVPHWSRGTESATILEPRVSPMRMLGLGGSIGTPPGGITAEVVVAEDEDALDALGDAVKDKIVLFNKVMPPYHPEKGAGYGSTVRYRTHGADFAAAKGAVACLVRSVTAHSLRTPHTGAMRYGDEAPKIPAAAISTEDAEMIARLFQRGTPVKVKLEMQAQTLPDAESANAVAELRGSTRPEEVVVMGGHIDAWDVGQGAHDDGAGCVMAMEAINVLRKLGLTPKRTIRVVLWTNEENGLAGGRAYAERHADDLDKHVAAIESDSGAFKPQGYGLSCTDKEREKRAVGQMSEILSLIEPHVGPLQAKAGGGGADISPMKDSGVVLIGHHVEGSHYFDYHHTEADTIDKVDPRELSQNVAVLAATAYILADMPTPIGK